MTDTITLLIISTFLANACALFALVLAWRADTKGNEALRIIQGGDL